MPSNYLFRVPAVLTATFILSACGSADDENSLTGAFNKNFNESWNTEFVAGCVAEATKAGAAEADATPLCDCMAKELNEKLDGIGEKMNPPQEKLEAAGEICFGSI
ncbi:hypothetical protein [Parasphingorhabdus cellanae]|uniref:Lipoprotein n=1 Tax=Parasphingorhabdus cellanae TaxID=2806553 RepID=A0ABX7T0L1_9SPHN|nr:hypothetical protein [Parasphingorhabdus cellanae]QTD55081.1 hypothetical protein J4G78_12705 [Parasphingorhabdus cellanae]